MAKDFSKCWYPDSGQDILEVVDDTDIFICLKDKFGNAIHNKNLASFTRYNKETGEKSKYVLLRPLESYGEDDEENFVFKNRIVYRVDEVEGRHVLVKESDSDKIMSVYTRFYMGMMSGEIPIDSTEYDDFREDVYDECRGVDEYDFNDEEYDDDEDEEADKDEADEVSDADSEKLPPLGEAVNPNMVNMLWSEECETDIVDIMAMGDRNVILFIKNDEGKRDEYVRAGMFEYEGMYYALLAPVIEGKICKDLVAFRIEDGGKHRNHVLRRVKDAALCKRIADKYRELLVRYGNKK